MLTGVLTLLSMLKIWSYAFWSPQAAPIQRTPANLPNTSSLRPAYVGATLLVCVALFLGFGAQPVCEIAFRAGDQLVNTDTYIQAVLGPHALDNLARYRAESATRLAAAAGVEVMP